MELKREATTRRRIAPTPTGSAATAGPARTYAELGLPNTIAVQDPTTETGVTPQSVIQHASAVGAKENTIAIIATAMVGFNKSPAPRATLPARLAGLWTNAT